jgi:hypothetical protein
MTEIPGSPVWTWSKTAVAAALLTLAAWAVSRFDPLFWPSALAVGVGLALLTRLLTIRKERSGEAGEGVLILGASPVARLVAEMDDA